MNHIIFTGFLLQSSLNGSIQPVSSILTFMLFTSVVFFVTIKISDVILFTVGAGAFFKESNCVNPVGKQFVNEVMENYVIYLVAINSTITITIMPNPRNRAAFGKVFFLFGLFKFIIAIIVEGITKIQYKATKK